MNHLQRKSQALLPILLLFVTLSASAKTIWFDGSKPVNYNLPAACDPVVATAARMFADDMEAVTGQKAVATKKNPQIVVTQLDRAGKSQVKNLKNMGVPVDEILNLTDGFNITTDGQKILVTGRNGRGAAYGLLELSRMAGVSPWIWWGDAVPEKRDTLTLPDGYSTTQGASVEYRGIFLNDEDWSLRPWSTHTFSPAENGEISAATYRKVCELLLRLRANAIWPAMHEGTKAFFLTPGAKEVADSCGIAIGSSHCEPLLRNNVGEWNKAEMGSYNYRTNRQAVHDYWAERLRQVKGSSGGNLLTIGMRGIHDSSMEGYKTPQEKFDALQEVIDNQQTLIRQYLGAPEKQTQIFVPYKEVLELYEKGLKVPDYVTLMWCDDNYGYITRLSDSDEQKRTGGAGIYYHLSYWGRPHDYLWLCTTQPGLIYYQLKSAYDHNVRKVWIANVHDPKAASYDLELFLDLAWNIGCVENDNTEKHYKNWLTREFGAKAAEKLFPAMLDFYRLTGQRKPEFMGWNQVELDKKQYNRGLGPISLSQLSTKAFGNELDRYLGAYAAVANTANEAASDIRPELSDAYFATILYPVLASEAHARKMLEAHKARSFASGGTTQKLYDQACIATAKSQQAYQTVRQLTELYNSMNNGKWEQSMSMRPRDLPVFAAPLTPLQLTDKEVADWLKVAPAAGDCTIEPGNVVARNADSYDSATGSPRKISMLGHSMNAVSLPKDGELTYNFSTEFDSDATVRLALIPTQPNDNGSLRFSVSVDGTQPVVFDLKEPFRSEQWKLNVLRGQARREFKTALKPGKHTLTIKALDNNIVFDQWMVDPVENRQFYLFPTE